MGPEQKLKVLSKLMEELMRDMKPGASDLDEMLGRKQEMPLGEGIESSEIEEDMPLGEDEMQMVENIENMKSMEEEEEDEEEMFSLKAPKKMRLR